MEHYEIHSIAFTFYSEDTSKLHLINCAAESGSICILNYVNCTYCKLSKLVFV
jgi:hypothetical protein